MSRSDELRMMLRVAQLYYEGELKQAQISEQLHVSQATVSRLLKRAEAEGVVRVSIAVPRGTYPQFEDGLRQRYGLDEAIVAECYEDSDESILSAIGSAAAHYFETTVSEGEVIGISAWSISLLRMVDAIGRSNDCGPNASSRSSAASATRPCRATPPRSPPDWRRSPAPSRNCCRRAAWSVPPPPGS